MWNWINWFIFERLFKPCSLSDLSIPVKWKSGILYLVLNYFCPVSTIQYGQCRDKCWNGGQETGWISRATSCCISTTCFAERILMNNMCFEMLLVPLLYCFPMSIWMKVQCNSRTISALFSSKPSQNSLYTYSTTVKSGQMSPTCQISRGAVWLWRPCKAWAGGWHLSARQF